MRNPALWARIGGFCFLTMGTGCWSTTSATAAEPPGVQQGVGTSAQAAASVTIERATRKVDTRVSVGNSSASPGIDSPADGVAHAIPTLDGSGLLVLASLLGVAALWMWRRRQ